MGMFRLSFGSGSIYFHLRFWYEPGCLVRVLFGSARVSLGSGSVNEGDGSEFGSALVFSVNRSQYQQLFRSKSDSVRVSRFGQTTRFS
ncbi:hypothetical protein Hdeb2414_s0011g00368191 [Helianthus debilis subsp. tardiflorus]